MAPVQTLPDPVHQRLRSAALAIIRALGVEGGCNVQFALSPDSRDYAVIEVNPRVSRSSALASKATGYPIARVAAQIAIGRRLAEIPNAITRTTVAAFEPALDYVVVKLPRFPFDKFPSADRSLGSQMKATGEVMAIDRTFAAALNKAFRSLEQAGAGVLAEDPAWGPTLDYLGAGGGPATVDEDGLMCEAEAHATRVARPIVLRRFLRPSDSARLAPAGPHASRRGGGGAARGDRHRAVVPGRDGPPRAPGGGTPGGAASGPRRGRGPAGTTSS